MVSVRRANCHQNRQLKMLYSNICKQWKIFVKERPVIYYINAQKVLMDEALGKAFHSRTTCRQNGALASQIWSFEQRNNEYPFIKLSCLRTVINIYTLLGFLTVVCDCTFDKWISIVPCHTSVGEKVCIILAYSFFDVNFRNITHGLVIPFNYFI